MTTVKITELTDIGANLATSTVVPVVNMAGTPTTQKTNIGNIANIILEGAGVDYPEASVALIAQTVSNAAQPNITSVGTLTTVAISGNASVNGNLTSNGTAYVGNLSTTGIATITTLSVGTTANLGAVGNVKITGGTAGQVLSTDGAGNLSWATDTGGNVQSIIANGSSNVSIPTSGGNISISIGGTDLWSFDGQGHFNLSDDSYIGNIEDIGATGFNMGANTDFAIRTTDGNTSYIWEFGVNGEMTVPDQANGQASIVSRLGNSALSSFLSFATPGSPNLVLGTTGNNHVIINTDKSNANVRWSFDDTGNLTLPGNTFAVNYANGTQVSIGGGSGNTGNVTFDDVTVQGVNQLNLSAGPDFTANLAYLQVRSGDVASHIHLDTGNNEAYDLIVGNDAKFVQVSSTGNIIMSSYDGNTSYTWTLDTTGNLILAGGESVIQSVANSSLDPINPNVSTMILTPSVGYSSQSLVLDPTAPGHIHLRAPSSNIDEPLANIFLGGEDSSFEVGYYNGAVPNVFIHSNNNTWTFDTTGNLTLPLGSIVYETNIPDGALSGSAIALKPIGGTTANQQLLIYPTAADGDHIHMTSGNLYETELFLGSDNFYVKLANTGNVIINSNDGNSSNAMWTFSNDGTTTFPTGNITSNTSLQLTTTFANVKTVEYQTAGIWDLYVEDSITGSNTASSRLNVSFKDNLIDKPQVYIENTKESDGIALRWTFDENGTLNFPRDVAGNTDPILTIVGGANPSISAIDASLAGPANLGISALNTIFTGFTGDAIKIYPDDGEISSTANLQIWANSGGNTEYSWTFDTTGNLTVPGDLVIAGNTSVFGTNASLIAPAGNLPLLSVSSGSNGGVSSLWVEDIGNVGTSNIAAVYANPTSGSGIVRIAVGQNGGNAGPNLWDFGTDGNLTIPGSSGGFIKTVANASIGIAAVDNGTNNPAQLLSMTNAGAATSIVSAYATNATIQTNATGAINTWAFDSAGNLTLPGNTFAVNYANGTQVPVGVTQDITSNGAMSIMLYDGNIKYNNYATVEPSTGNIAGGNISTTGVVTANTANITTGNITTINSGLLQNGNSNITITSNGNVSIQAAGSNVELVVTSTGANITGTLTSTGKIGYASGSTVTQTSNRGNGVNINALAGTIVTVSASMTAGEIGAFPVTNNQVDANNDIVLVQVVSPNLGNYNVIANPNSGIGGFYLTLQNISGFPISAEAVTIRFMVIKAPNA